jgi:hypothetical protein
MEKIPPETTIIATSKETLVYLYNPIDERNPSQFNQIHIVFI